MKVAIYTRFWNTAGGGEVYAGTLAEVLAKDHDVHLLSEFDIDLDRLQSRLGLRLSELTRRTLGDIDDVAFARATSAYDVFVNCSHGSQRVNGARHGVYVVHFPAFASLEHRNGPLARTIGRRLRHGGRIEWGSGIHGEEVEGDRSWRWTEGVATLRVHAPRGRRLSLDLVLSTAARPEGTEAEVLVKVDGTTTARLPSERKQHHLSVDVVGRATPVLVTLHTEAFSPHELVGIDDYRSLGVQIELASLRGARISDRIASRLLVNGLEPEPHAFLETYDTVISNSPYTAKWIKKRWNMRSTLVEPPVRLRTGGNKEHWILSVGRFFSPGSGHSKRQPEMVRAFKELVEFAPGWELHLVGGCSEVDQPYLDHVRELAEDLPIHLHVNASGADLDRLYAGAAVYWHAAGLGEDAAVHPERLEHFGISVVEGMSAGAVPVVLSEGGPSEIVRRERDGLHFVDVEGLVRATRRLIDDPLLLGRMSTASSERASNFGRSAFEEKISALFSNIGHSVAGNE